MKEPTKAQINREYWAGRESGDEHAKLAPHWQQENERKCNEGRNNSAPLIAAYWRGYAKAAKF